MQNKSESASADFEVRPTFKYSAVLEILGIGWGFTFVFIATTYGVYSGVASPYGAAWIGIIEVYLLYEIIFRWRLGFRTVRFYGDRAVVQRGDSQQEVSYSDIRSVKLEGSTLFGRKVRIFIASRDRPLTIPRNPKNPTSKLDLYSWLFGKINETRSLKSL